MNQAQTTATTEPASAEAQNPADSGVATVELETPIKRGTTEISTLKLRKPNAGALRGVNMAELLQMNVTALQTVLPRITEPTLARHEIDQLEPPDLLNIGIEVAGFFATRAEKAQYRNT